MKSNAKSHGGSRVSLGVSFLSLSPKIAAKLQPVDGGEGHGAEMCKVAEGRLLCKCINASPPRLFIVSIAAINFDTHKILLCIEECSDRENELLGASP